MGPVGGGFACLAGWAPFVAISFSVSVKLREVCREGKQQTSPLNMPIFFTKRRVANESRRCSSRNGGNGDQALQRAGGSQLTLVLPLYLYLHLKPPPPPSSLGTTRAFSPLTWPSYSWISLLLLSRRQSRLFLLFRYGERPPSAQRPGRRSGENSSHDF